jgi:hypothetical protein
MKLLLRLSFLVTLVGTLEPLGSRESIHMGGAPGVNLGVSE